MALQMYHWKWISKSAPRLKCTALVRNYCRPGEQGGSGPRAEMGRPRSLISVDVLAFLHRTTLTWAEVKVRLKWRQERTIREAQRYMPERQRLLGPDISVAHVITHLNGKVKFRDHDAWMTYEDVSKRRMPSRYVPNMYIEAVDASETSICYEGFDNFTHVFHLKELILRKCPFIDDWCLNRLSMFEATLEHLDISGCRNVSERGIAALHNLKNLKTLVLNDTPNIANKELVCLLLQEIVPQCNIVGVDYESPSLWDRLKEYLT